MKIDLNYNYKKHLIFLVIGICLGVVLYFYMHDNFWGESSLEEQWVELENNDFPITKEEFLKNSQETEKLFLFISPYFMSAILSGLFFLLRDIVKNQDKISTYIIAFAFIFVAYIGVGLFTVIPLLFYDLYKIIFGRKTIDSV